jgi:DNA-binding transcriptional regulator YiaG
MQPDEVKAARQALGMSLHQLAVALRMGTDGRRAVRRWETGDRHISGPAAVAIEALLCGWRPEHLIQPEETNQ